jgi:DNA-binding transcriptional LysR family regulator
MNPSIRQLQAFMALAELGSFTRAAHASHLSQPAFSALIRGLEEGLGLRLFHRSTRQVALTAEGLAFVEPARRVLAEMDSALAGLRDVAALRRGRVSMALLPSLAAGWLPGVLAPFRQAHPGVELEVADVLSEDCIARVASGQADFALAAIRADTPELQAEPFCEDDFHLVCPADHPLARARPLTVAKLAAWPFVHLSRTSSVRQYLEAAFHPQAMQTLMAVDQLATVMGMVRAGLGISVVPALTLFHFDQPGLVTRPLKLPGLTRQIYLVRRRDRGLSVAAQALHDRMLAARPLNRA